MKKILSLLGVGVLVVASFNMIKADDDVNVTNRGNAWQRITTTAFATSGDVEFTVEDNEHFGEMEFRGGSLTTGNAGAFATTEAIANQFVNSVRAHDDARVRNYGDAHQFVGTTADAFSGEVEMEVEDNEHFHEMEFGGGNKSTGLSQSESYTGAWANIFNTTIRH